MVSRGRGRGAGRRGERRNRAVRRGRVTRNTARVSTESDTVKQNKFDLEAFDANTSNLTELFLVAETPLEAHLKAQDVNKWRYLAAFNALKANGVDILQIAKSKALEAALARTDTEMTEVLLNNTVDFGVVEVLKALSNMDCARKARAQEKRLAKMKLVFAVAGQKGKSRIGKRMAEVKKNIHNFTRDAPCKGTMSGAMSRKIRHWTRQIPADQLDFFALHLPKETWKQLADICHLHPEKDFPNAPWFLRHCFAADNEPNLAPVGTWTHACKDLTAETVNEVVANTNVPFGHLKHKQLTDSLTEDSKKRIANYMDTIDMLIWDYEDLRCPGVDEVIARRLDAGERVTLPYGKLMERLLFVRKSAKTLFYAKLLPHAEAMLKDIRYVACFSVPVESPVVVIGDASASMDVAIETSTIVASFLTAITNAELVFFSNDLILPKFTPNSIDEVLELALATKTVGSTCHAAALLPFYEKKQVVKTFIVCTDEEENQDVRLSTGESLRFQPLFARYYKEVYPARLVFISFLNQQHSPGQMVPGLREAGFPVCQFKLDHRRPDLTKLNNLVGQLAIESADFGRQINTLENQLRNNGLQTAFDKLKLAA